MEALCDTGSDLNILNSKWCKGIKLGKSSVQIRSANGEKLKVLRTLVTNVEIDDDIRKVDFVVCSDISQNCILGTKFFSGKQGKTICFEVSKNEKGNHCVLQHEISVNVETPVAFPMRRYTLDEETAIEETINKWLKDGIIRKSFSAWRSPLVIVPKKSGELRLCNDFRKLNAITIRDMYPLPSVEDIFDTMQGARVFSKMDAKSGYHQVEMREDDKAKTAFACKKGIF